MNPPRADAVPHANGADLRQRRFERSSTPLALADWNGFAARRAASEARRQDARPWARGFSRMTVAWHSKSASPSVPQARRFNRDPLRHASDGAGHRDSYVQLAVDVVGGGADRIRIVAGRHHRTNGFAAPARARCSTGGSAVRVAVRAHGRHAKQLAGESLEVAAPTSENREGPLAVVGTMSASILFELAGAPARAALPMSPRPATVEAPAAGARSRLTPVPASRGRSTTRRSTTSAPVVSPTIERRSDRRRAVQGIGHGLTEQDV